MAGDRSGIRGSGRASRRSAFVAIASWVLVAVAATVLGSGCASTQDPPRAVKKATIAITKFTGSAAIYVARDKGFFAEEGLDANLPVYSSGGLAVAAVADGKADMGTAAETPIVRAIMNGKPLAVVATISEVEHSNVVVARKDAGIASVGDLAGKKVGLARGTAADFFLHILLLSSRVDPKTVTIVPLQADAVVAAITSRQVDAVCTWDPYVDSIVRELGDTALVLDEPGLYALMWNVVTRTDLTKSDPDLLARVTRALARGNDYVLAHPEEAQRITAKATGIDLATIQGKWADYRATMSLDQSLLLSMEDEARWMRSDEGTGPASAPNFLDNMYLGALETVRPSAVRIIK